MSYPNIEELSSQFTNSIQDQLNNFIQFSNQIINDFQSIAERQTWIDNIKDKEYEISNSLSLVNNHIKTFDPTKDKKLKELVKNSEIRIKKLNEDLTKTEKLLENAQKKAVESEVSNYGDFFWEEAVKNKKASNINFWFMIISVALTAACSIIFLQNIKFISSEELGFWDNLLRTISMQNILIKFVILSLCGYLISHFSKVHSVEKHLYNINIQRQNALGSHKQILDSVIATESENEKEIRNTILLELTKAIFKNKETGYLKNTGSNSSPTNSIVEITRSIGK